MKKAVMLCAGRGSRLGSFTEKAPKPLLKINGKSIIENSVQNLIDANYDELVIVVGYKSELIRAELESYKEFINIEFIYNDIWDETNNIYSLWLARAELDKSITLIEGDIFFTQDLMNEIKVLNENENHILVSPLNSLLEGAFIETDAQGFVTSFQSTKSDPVYIDDNALKTVNIYQLSGEFNKYLNELLDAEIEKGNVNSYYEECFVQAFYNGVTFKAVNVPSNSWFEIDNAYDLSIGEFQFSDIVDKHEKLKSQHGGYWRYPIMDSALIYNLHFPPEEMKKKMKDRFDDILLNYPASSRKIEQYLALFLGTSPGNLVIANGVSEFIKILPLIFREKVVLTEPSFNEYANCFNDKNIVSFKVREEDDFEVNTQLLIQLIQKEHAEALVLISPDNPSGKMITKKDIKEIYHNTEEQGTIIILDESFIDFSNDGEAASFMGDIERYPRLLILKSMSKTFGIGGLRLGYAASSNSYLLDKIKRNLPIWNINGFAEEFIFNLPQYKKQYLSSCQVVRRETDNLVLSLKQISELKIFNTDSNFVLCKLKNKQFTADQFAKKLLEHDIYIKECSGKSMTDSEYFFRVSSRTKEENKKLINAIEEIFSYEQAAMTI